MLNIFKRGRKKAEEEEKPFSHLLPVVEGVWATHYPKSSQGALLLLTEENRMIDPAIHEAKFSCSLGKGESITMSDQLPSATIIIDADMSDVKQQKITAFLDNLNLKHVTKEDISFDASPFAGKSTADSLLTENKMIGFVKKKTSREVDKLELLPAMPDIAREIMDFQSKGSLEGSAFVAIISKDPALSAHLVSISNTAFYGGARKCQTVHDAVIMTLGVNLSISIAIGVAMSKNFVIGRNHEDFVKRVMDTSIETAILSQGLSSRDNEHGFNPASYLSGLLSCFGYLTILHLFPFIVDRLESVRDANPSLDDGYSAAFLIGLRPEEITRSLLVRWGMDEEVISGACDWADTKDSNLSKIVCLARSISCEKRVSLKSLALSDEIGLNHHALSIFVNQLYKDGLSDASEKVA